MLVSKKRVPALSFLAICSMLLAQAGLCSERINMQHDWTIKLESQELKQTIGSPITMQAEKMYRVNVYAHENGSDAEPVLFEQLWYVKGEDKARGLRRLAKLPIPEGKSVEIKLSCKNTVADQSAVSNLADATVRLLLEAYLNKDSVPLVQAPSEFSAAVLSGLNNKHFLPDNNQADVIGAHPVTFVFQNELDSSAQRLVFKP